MFPYGLGHLLKLPAHVETHALKPNGLATLTFELHWPQGETAKEREF